MTLAQAMEVIRTDVYQRHVNHVRQVLANQGKDAYDLAKARLPAFAFAGVFVPSRAIANLQQHSGIVHGDLDHLADVPAVKRAICTDPRTVYAFISPSAHGLKIGVHVPIVGDDATYKHAWHTVSTEYEQRYGGRWDPSGKDVSRLCYVSYDPDLYWDPTAVVFEVAPRPIPEPPHPALRRAVPRSGRHFQDYAEQAIRTAVLMIHAAELGTRHSTRLRAARLLGGYVAGGLLSADQAYGALAQALVGHTDDLQRALATVEDGLRYGIAHPITPEKLEAERVAWLEQHTPLRCDGDLLPLRPYAGYRPYRGGRKGVWHG
jgi:hypothetical protein